MKTYSASRKKIHPDIETKILISSRRKCALCFGLNFDLSEKRGQIVHLDHNRENNDINNLVFLCLDHHDRYDSISSQSKGLTEKEVKYYRSMLHSEILTPELARVKANYRYSYFSKISYFINTKDVLDIEAKAFLKELDSNKRLSDQSIMTFLQKSNIDINRIRKINDYLFKIYRDIWFIQKKWKEIKDRYFQGRVTVIEIPDYLSDGEVQITGLSDQTDDWEDIGYTEEYAPVQLECHVYDGPSGQGFAVFGRVKINDEVWQNKMHIGPEIYRNDNNFMWIKVNNSSI